MFVQDIQSGLLIVCDIPTPHSLEAKGYNSRVMADKLINSVRLGGSKKSELFPEYDVPEVTINPVIITMRTDAEHLTVYGNSYNQFLSLISKLLCKPIPTIRGNVVETAPDNYLFAFSINGSTVYKLTFAASGTEKVIETAGYKICSRLFPYELATSYYAMERHHECLSALENYFPQNADQSAMKMVLQGAANIGLFEYDAALKEFVSAYEVRNKPFILHNIATVRLEQCLYDQAIAFEKGLIASKRETEYGHMTAGIAYSKLLDLKNAEKHFQRALDINRDFAPAYFQWGVMLWLRHNDLMGAADKFRQCIEVDPNFYQAAANLTNIYAELGQIKESRTYAEKALSILKNKSINVNFKVKGDTLVIAENLPPRTQDQGGKSAPTRRSGGDAGEKRW